jgi:SAM-dependent methyltransferase
VVGERAFDQVAPAYAARYGGDPAARALSVRLYQELERHLSPGAQILDVGCGPGTHAIPLAQAGFRVMALDLAAQMIIEVERRAAGAQLSITTHHGPVEGLPSSPRYDAAIAIHGPFNYDLDPRPLASAIHRVLAPGGRLWIGAPRAASFKQLLRHPRRGLAPLLRSPRAHEAQLEGQTFTVHLWDPRTLARCLAPWFELEHFEASTLGFGDGWLNEWPGLRHLGHSSLIRLARLPAGGA